MQKFTIEKNEAGQRFDKFLIKYLPAAPKSFIYKMLRKKNITLNGKKAIGDEILSVSDTVESFFSDETFSKFSALSTEAQKNNQINIHRSNRLHIKKDDIVYEDDNILLVNKRPGILTQKADFHDYSLNEWLIDYMLENGQITEKQLKTFKPSVCNRLDRNTGGIVICGKSLIGIQTMTELIRNKDIEKHYITICHGNFTAEGRIEALIDKDSKGNKSTVTNNLPKGTKPNIITEFTVLKRYADATLLDVNLLTGKSHQIRAQLSSLGNPIWGDKKYGGSKAEHQLLYAYKLIFPSSDKMAEEFNSLADKTFELSMPEYFNKVINKF